MNILDQVWTSYPRERDDEVIAAFKERHPHLAWDHVTITFSQVEGTWKVNRFVAAHRVEVERFTIKGGRLRERINVNAGRYVNVCTHADEAEAIDAAKAFAETAGIEVI